MTAFSASPIRFHAALLAATLFALGTHSLPAAALRPTQLTPETAASVPYRDSGRLNVTHGAAYYIGTASYIRRYTGLTAGHLLYDSKTGFAKSVHYEGALYIESINDVPVSTFEVLSGYQAATANDPDSDAAFDHDMGYLLFAKPALNDEWVTWSDNTSELGSSGPFWAVGYAAQTLSGDELATVQHQTPYFQELPPAFYANEAYYTEGGMSGGPVYVKHGGEPMTMIAINVAGTDYTEKAFSGARAITPTETPLLLAAEYDQGLITGAVLKGPATVAAGGTAKFKAGLIFVDGAQEGGSIPVKYDGDVTLVAKGPYKQTVVITKAKAGKYSVAFPASIPVGTQVPLDLLRTALPKKGQKPLQTALVTVQ